MGEDPSDIEEVTLQERGGPKDRQMQYWRPNWELRWIEPLTPDFGFALTVGHNDAIVRQHFSLPVWNFGTPAQAAADARRAAEGLPPLNTVSVRNPAMTRELLHDAPIKDTNDYATLRVDWRPTRAFTPGYSTSWNYYTNQTADDVRYISAGYIRNGRVQLPPNQAAGVETTRYLTPQEMIDISLEYSVTRWARLFFSGRNVTSELNIREAVVPGAPSYSRLEQANNLGTVYTVGITGMF